ncbi:MAG TPA: hypothetical protein VHH35_08665, partial [Pyrinomonadaceae bacterium]|nr:hypothetical protein [Pyrinomonadaceae bacterium]
MQKGLIADAKRLIANAKRLLIAKHSKLKVKDHVRFNSSRFCGARNILAEENRRLADGDAVELLYGLGHCGLPRVARKCRFRHTRVTHACA